jgi:hypothetical protein
VTIIYDLAIDAVRYGYQSQNQRYFLVCYGR